MRDRPISVVPLDLASLPAAVAVVPDSTRKGLVKIFGGKSNFAHVVKATGGRIEHGIQPHQVHVRWLASPSAPVRQKS